MSQLIYLYVVTGPVVVAILVCLCLLSISYFVYSARPLPESSGRFRWPIALFYNHQKIEGNIMEFQLMAGFELPFVLGKPVDSQGNERPIEGGSLIIGSSDESVFTVERDELAEDPDDPFVGKIVWRKEGSAVLKIEADADLGEGVKPISQEITGTMLAEGAVGFAPISFGAARKHEETSAGKTGE